MRISSANPGWQIERADDGALLVSPTGTPGGAKSGEAFAQLYLFAKRAAGKTYASNTGFKTPEGGVVCPDASWVCAERVEQFRQQVGFWEMMPDVAIEVASPSDSWTTLRAKIDKFISDGAGFAIAIACQPRDLCQRFTTARIDNRHRCDRRCMRHGAMADNLRTRNMSEQLVIPLHESIYGD